MQGILERNGLGYQNLGAINFHDYCEKLKTHLNSESVSSPVQSSIEKVLKNYQTIYNN